MSVLGLRSRIKSGLKRAFGQESAPEPARAAPPAPRAAPPPPPPLKAVEDLPEDSVQAPEVELPGPAPAVTQPAPVEAAPSSAPAVDEASGRSLDDEGGISFDAVQEILDDMVRPALQGDGGDITLLKVEDDSIYVRLVGACSTCPSSIMTMKMGVEALLREEFPTMQELVQVDA